MVAYQWIESEVPEGLQVRQVYGFLFDVDGRVLLLEDEGQYNLPGGKPENTETVAETLARETLEEVQTTIISCEYLGYQLVEEEERFAQVRLVATIGRIFSADVDPSTGRKYIRLLVPPKELNGYLGWDESGEQQIACAVAAASRFGVRWDGTPLGYVETI